MSFVLGLWLVCGFLANLPTAFSIQCYACGDYPGSKVPCEGSSAIQCESYFDSCSSLKATVEFAGAKLNVTVKNCSIAETPACNQTYNCNLVNKSVVAAGGHLLECDLTCCHTDRCNGQDEGEPQPPTPGPNQPQSFRELKYYIETLRAQLDQLEYIVDNELEGHLSAREYKERVKEVLDDFCAAVANEGEQKSNAIIDELKKNGQSKKRAAMSMRLEKREAKSYQLLSEAMETIQESLAKLAAQKR